MTPIPVSTQSDNSARVISGYNVNDVHQRGLAQIYSHGLHLRTRNGSARSLPGPLISHYKHPQFRVLFDPRRDANPFFHLFESLWMIAGRNDLQGVSQFVASMANFSDDGKTLNGAYGYRWRHSFASWGSNGDQITTLISELRNNPESRRCVLQMWDTERDLMNQKSKDLCCNLLVKYRVLSGQLHAYVLNRSNDMVFGGYGANVFHFSFLQDYIADMVGVTTGSYEQVSLDAHIYDEGVYGDKLWANVKDIVSGSLSDDLYRPQAAAVPSYALSPVRLRPSWYTKDGAVYSYKIDALTTMDEVNVYDADFIEDCDVMLRDCGAETPSGAYLTPYFSLVVAPMRDAYAMFRAKEHQKAIDRLTDASGALNRFLTERYEDGNNEFLSAEHDFIKELDLFVAGKQWLQRRLDAVILKEQA